MPRKNLLAGFVAGAATVVVAMMILSSAGRTMPRVMAQAVQPRDERPVASAAASPRYQISAWGQSGGPGWVGARGAFVIDTQSGQIWELDVPQGRLRPFAKVEAE